MHILERCKFRLKQGKLCKIACKKLPFTEPCLPAYLFEPNISLGNQGYQPIVSLYEMPRVKHSSQCHVF